MLLGRVVAARIMPVREQAGEPALAPPYRDLVDAFLANPAESAALVSCRGGGLIADGLW